MDRFTIRNSDGSVSQPTNMKWAEAFERLAEYEDTGLSPARIVELMNADMRPVFRSKWKLVSEDPDLVWECENCCYKARHYRPSFCGNCGSDMRAAMGEAET